MGEPLYEQVMYGGVCKHGTSTGTPGGADLLCQHCEDGADTWDEWTVWRFHVGIVRLDDGQMISPADPDRAHRTVVETVVDDPEKAAYVYDRLVGDMLAHFTEQPDDKTTYGALVGVTRTIEGGWVV